MASKTLRTVPRRGDIRSVKEDLGGPVKIYLNTDERDETGELLMEEYEDMNGETKERQRRDPEPFLEKVMYRKNYMTPKTQERVKALGKSEEYKGQPIKSAAAQIEIMVASWDMTDGDEPILPTEEDIIAHDVPGEIVYAVLNQVMEYNRPPKALRDRLQSTSSQEE